MSYFLYVAVKLVAYSLWCWVGLRLFEAHSVSFIKASGFGLLRLCIGIAFGIAIFLLLRAQSEDLLWKYIAIYTPVRMAEWFILVLIIGRDSENQTSLKAILWCLGGIVVSFAADLASPEGIAGHFCVGRCLC